MSLRGLLGALVAALKALTPGLGDSRAARRVDEIFSWEVIGSIFVAGAAGKVFEKTVEIHMGGDPAAQRLGFAAVFVLGLVAFAWWHEIRKAGEEAVDAAGEAAEDAVDTVTDGGEE